MSKTRQITYEEMRKYGQSFKSMRESVGFTLQQMADEVGTFRTTLSKWEKGLIIPQTDIYEIEQRFKKVIQKYGDNGIKGKYILDSIFTVDQYIGMKLKGYRDSKIAMDLYVSYQTLERWKTRHGINRKLVNEKRYEVMMEMIKSGVKLGSIPAKMKLTPRQCQRIRKEYGVTFN
jgi:DNA-binding transcriptional regulator YiaG